MLKPLSMACLLGGAIVSAQLAATEVEIRTNIGTFNVNLFDEQTPITVQNFLEYVNSGSYANTIVHRSEPGFVVQSGGFTFSESAGFGEVTTGMPILNEPVLSNVRGTISMAKLGSSVNSATSQWFINLDNNSANLDVQNGGFTVFGQVIGDGMDVVDAMADLPRFTSGGFSSLPLQNYTATDATNGVALQDSNLVLIEDIVIVDDATSTNPDITPSPNTLIGQTPDEPAPVTGSSGGGSLGFLLAPLALLAGFRRFR